MPLRSPTRRQTQRKLLRRERTRESPGAKAAALPQRFVSMIFDDVHFSREDAVFVRDSASRFFGALAPSDRVSLRSTSGQLTQEFTSDHEKLANALLGIVPRPLAFHSSTNCPDLSYYQADLIENKNHPHALELATHETMACTTGANLPVALA